MAIQLSAEDFDELVRILARQEIWRTETSRWDFVLDMLAGSPRKDDLQGSLNLAGNARGAAVRVIERLAGFGQDAPGRESLGVLINRLIREVGGGADVEFLRGLFTRYLFVTQPVVQEPRAARWEGMDTPALTAEKIIGENTLRHIRYLDLLLDAARAVVRISGPYGTGSGFMIADDLVMTNNHVIGASDKVADCEFKFNYQLDRFGNVAPVTAARGKPGGAFLTSPDDSHGVRPDALDYTIVQLDNPPAADKSPTGLGVFAPLPLRLVSVGRDARVSIIQHPGGDYKKISMQNNFVAYADALVLQYTTSTEPGSSGSPVLNDDAQVVAIHHAGSDTMLEPATGRRYFRNEGILMRAIVEDVRTRAPEIYARLELA